MEKLFGVKAPETSKFKKFTKRANDHYVLTLPDCSNYGFKNWSTAPENGGIPSECSERDQIFNTIAHLVEAPNVCKTKHCSDIPDPPFDNKPLVISEWIRDGKAFDDFEENDKQTIRSDGAVFFRKYGEWVTLGKALGFRDWTTNNLVWSEKTEALALVDLDWSFDCCKSAETDFVKLVKSLSPIDSATLDTYIQQFREGINAMQSKIFENKRAIEEILQTAASAELRTFLLNDTDKISEDAEEMRTKLESI